MALRPGKTKSQVSAPPAKSEQPTFVPPPPSPELFSAPLSKELCAATFVLALVVYVKTLYPTIAPGDSAELIFVAHALGVAHPPGYPLFTILGNLFSRLPFGNIAWRINLGNAFCASTASAFLYLAVLRLTHDAWAAFAAAGLWSFAPLVWLYAIGGEVFALNNLFNTSLIFLMFTFIQNPTPKTAHLGAFLCGLALTNQHTVVFPVIAYIASVLWIGRSFLFSQKEVLILLRNFFGAMLLYAYLPIAGSFTPVAAWGDPRSVSGFLRILLRGDYGTFQLASKEIGQTGGFLGRMNLYAWYSTHEWLAVGWILGFLGIFVLLVPKLREKSSLPGSVLLTSGVVSAFTFCFYLFTFQYLANLPHDNPLMMGVQARFYPQANIQFFIWIGVGIAFLRNKLPDGTGRIFCVIIVLSQIILGWKINDNSQNWISLDYGKEILDPLPHGALLLTRGDLSTNSVRYLKFCENYRTDVTILDMEMMSWDWYGDMQLQNTPNVKFPGHHYHVSQPRTFNISRFLSANLDRFPGIYVSGGLKEGDNSAAKTHDMWAHGMTTRVYPAGVRPDLDQWEKDSRAAAPDLKKWKLKLGTPVPDSWEANVEAKLQAAFESRGYETLMLAIAKNDDVVLARISAMAYDTEIIPNFTEPIPANVYKNAGIAFSKLVNTPDQTWAVQKMIEYWTKFLELDNKDPQREQIIKAITDFKEWINQK
eukprot:TRINITY_DN18996_c0_g1_i1.p1 TRINITY_DN18996_c0_g1~~TRINITY_DN18996_c0_g1_i1.p1  ORF type:complete len:706 (-),score=171.02 TRINITY_DN18996_c0_g1_i1:14-2131(-)